MAEDIPAGVVIDTNVAVVANGKQPAASQGCVAACARALLTTMDKSTLYIDSAEGLSFIVEEYRNNLSASGQPGPGDIFFKWVLTNEHADGQIQRINLTALDNSGTAFEETPPAPEEIRWDPSDTKFLAVANASPGAPTILQALDSKWWGWTAALLEAEIVVHFLCPGEIEDLYKKKMEDGD